MIVQRRNLIPWNSEMIGFIQETFPQRVYTASLDLNVIFINIGNTLHLSDVNEQHSSLTTLTQLRLKNMQENIENIKVCVGIIKRITQNGRW